MGSIHETARSGEGDNVITSVYLIEDSSQARDIDLRWAPCDSAHTKGLAAICSSCTTEGRDLKTRAPATASKPVGWFNSLLDRQSIVDYSTIQSQSDY